MSFWVLENKKIPLYFGVDCFKFAYAVGIGQALKFWSKADATAFASGLDHIMKPDLDDRVMEHYLIVEHLIMGESK